MKPPYLLLRRGLLALAIFFSLHSLPAQTDLKPGDILFTLINMESTNTDAFGFVLLTDVEAGTEVYISENEYDATFGFAGDNEGTLRITFNAALSCGTEVIFTDQDPQTSVYTYAADIATVSVTQVSANPLAMTTAGETLILFQDDNVETPCDSCFITALANTGVDFGVIAQGSGALPPGLVIGQSAMVMRADPDGDEFDNIKYNCSETQADPTILQSELLKPDNWFADNEGPFPTSPCSPAFGCSAPIQVTISETQAILCNGDSTGTLIAEVMNGQEPFTFLWNGGFDQQTYSGLSAGSYSVTVTDANGAMGERSFTLEEPPALEAFSAVNAICAGTSEGLIAVESSGGTPPYSYLWSTGDTTETVSMLPVGTYGVTITDSNGCSFTFNPGVREIPLPTVTFSTDSLTIPVDVELQTGFSGGTPLGGTYSGPGVMDDGNGETYSFDPTGLDLGETTVTYTFRDPVTGCISSATDVIIVTEGLDGCRLKQPNRDIGLLTNTVHETGQQFVACTTGRLTEILLFNRDGEPFSALLKIQQGPFPVSPDYTQEINIPAGDSVIIQIDTGFNVVQDTLYSFSLLSLEGLFRISGTNTDVDRVFGGSSFQSNAEGEYIAMDQFAVTGRITIESDSTVVSTQLPRAAVTDMIAYPNPARGTFTVAYTLGEATELELVLFDVQGRLLRQQQLGRQLAGKSTLRVDATNLPAGIIAYGLRGGNGQMLIKRMVLIQ